MRVRAKACALLVAPGTVGMENCEGKKAEMEGFPPGTPGWGASAGCERAGWVVRVHAAVSVPPVAPIRSLQRAKIPVKSWMASKWPGKRLEVGGCVEGKKKG